MRRLHPPSRLTGLSGGSRTDLPSTRLYLRPITVSYFAPGDMDPSGGPGSKCEASSECQWSGVMGLSVPSGAPRYGPVRTCHQPQTSRRLEIRRQAANDVVALPGAIGLTRRAPVLPDGRFVTDGDSSAVVRRARSAVRHSGGTAALSRARRADQDYLRGACVRGAWRASSGRDVAFRPVRGVSQLALLPACPPGGAQRACIPGDGVAAEQRPG
jgi:hypothetical protein